MKFYSMLFVLPLLATCCARGPSQSNRLALTGRIVDATGKPVQASVWRSTTPVGLSVIARLADCDEDGSFSVRLRSGQHKISFRIEVPQSDSVTTQLVLGSRVISLAKADLDLGTLSFDVDAVKKKHGVAVSPTPSANKVAPSSQEGNAVPVKVDTKDDITEITIGVDPANADGHYDPKTGTITIDSLNESGSDKAVQPGVGD